MKDQDKEIERREQHKKKRAERVAARDARRAERLIKPKNKY